MIVLIASAFSAFAYVGFDYFLIKILGVQFNNDPSKANEILSFVALGTAVATIVGGYISKRFFPLAFFCAGRRSSVEWAHDASSRVLMNTFYGF